MQISCRSKHSQLIAIAFHRLSLLFPECEYLGDDCEELMKANDLKEWETAADVFPEASFELRVARKFKENDDIREDEETRGFLEDTLGISTGAGRGKVGGGGGDNDLDLEEEDDEEDDGDFDQDEDATDDGESLAEDDDFEKRLATDTIGKDKLDALSFTSEVGSYDEDAAASSVEEGNDAGNEKSPPRRGKRRRAARPGGDSTSGDESDERSGRSTDMGTMDVANIVSGKRSRAKVDYRK